MRKSLIFFEFSNERKYDKFNIATFKNEILNTKNSDHLEN